MIDFFDFINSEKVFELGVEDQIFVPHKFLCFPIVGFYTMYFVARKQQTESNLANPSSSFERRHLTFKRSLISWKGRCSSWIETLQSYTSHDYQVHATFDAATGAAIAGSERSWRICTRNSGGKGRGTPSEQYPSSDSGSGQFLLAT
jgi:hypothetical protein